MAGILTSWQAFLLSTAVVAGAIIAALVAHRFVFSILSRPDRRMRVIDASLVRHSRRPAKLVLPLLAVMLAERILPVNPVVRDALAHAIGLGLIGSVAWLLVLTIDVGEDLVIDRYRVDVDDNLTARRIRTQVQVLRRIAFTVLAIVTLSIMLMTFPEIRQIGASLLASAGLAGLILGMAMRSTLASLIAACRSHSRSRFGSRMPSL